MKTFLYFITVIICTESQSPEFEIYKVIKSNEYIKNYSISNICIKQMKLLIRDIFQKKMWALQMVDSTSKFPAGILMGNLWDMGNYDECLSISSNVNDMEIYGKFCVGSIIINKTLEYISEETGNELLEFFSIVPLPKVSICIPYACTANDLQIFFKTYFHFNDHYCYHKFSSPKLDPSSIVALGFFIILIGIVILSTLYEMYLIYNKKGPCHPLTLMFSAFTNSKSLFEAKNNFIHLKSINGLKALSMIWVVLAHDFLLYVTVPLTNYLEFWEILKSAIANLITAAHFSVDTFLVISGFLIIIVSYSKIVNNLTVKNLFLFYCHRYFRLTLPLIGMLWAHAFLFNYMGSGPLWRGTYETLQKPCTNNWWLLLMHLQNYFSSYNDICIPQSWFLSVSMQLYIITPFIILGFKKKPRLTYFLLSLISIISCLFVFLLGWNLNLKGTPVAQTREVERESFLKYYYTQTHTRMIPYLMGLVLGDFYMKSLNRPLKINKLILIIFWLMNISLMVFCIFWGHNFQFTNYKKLENILFLSVARQLWSLCICWIIFACSVDLGGFINTFLSSQVFQILSRLSYSIYLIHYPFIFITNVRRKNPLTFDLFDGILKFLGDLSACLLLSIVWCLLFELPIYNIENFIFQQYKINKVVGEKKEKTF